MATYQIKGRIKNLKDHQGINGVIVKAVLKKYDGTENETIGTSRETLPDGVFSIATDPIEPKDIKSNDLVFEIYSSDGGKLLQTTAPGLINDLIISKIGVEVTDIKDEILNLGSNYRIRGKVLNSDGSIPVSSGGTTGDTGTTDGTDEIIFPIHIYAYSVSSDGITESKINTTAVEIDDEGNYSIEFVHNNSNKLNLIVKVLNHEETETLITSPLVLNAHNNETINLSMGSGAFKGETEFNRVKTAIDDKLDRFSDLSDVKDKHFAIINNQVDLPGKQLDAYIHAKNFVAKLELGVGYVEVFYGLLQNGAPKSLDKLLLEDRESLGDKLDKAVENNIVSIDEAARNTKIEEIIAELPSYTLSVADTPLKKNLGLTTRLDEDQKKSFIRKYNENKNAFSNDEGFWGEMANDFTSEQIKELKCVFDLSALTKGHFPLIAQLFPTLSSGYENLSGLAVNDISAWEVLIGDDLPPGFADNTEYAQFLSNKIEKRYPSAVLTERVKNNGLPVVGTFNDDFDAFILANDTFEFGIDTIQKQIEDARIKAGLTDAFVANLEKLQRLYGLTPQTGKIEAIAQLWVTEIDSAAAITKMGRDKFFVTYASLGESVLHTMYSKAFNSNVRTIMSYAKYGKSFNEISTYVYNTFNYSTNGSKAMTGDIPGFEELFGAMDYCSCKHCLSVQSASSYLVDLLLFLNEGGVSGEDNRLFETLNNRRPDIANTLLSCKNTSTLVPYIDLVNEAMENLIAPIYTEPPGGGDPIPKYYQTERDTSEIKAYPDHINFKAYEELRNNAFYPWSLPFNLWAEESRGYLDFVGVKRHEMMERFPWFNNISGPEPQPENTIECKAGGPNLFDNFTPHTPLAIAIEHLGLTTREKDLICTNDLYELKDIYGCEDSINDIRNEDVKVVVSLLLEHTKLTYEELKEIITSNFVTNKAIVFDDPNICALDTATINLDNNELDRLHRFYRLKKKLGWTIKEIDMCMIKSGITDLNDDFIILLSNLKKLHIRYGTPIIELLAWFYDMDKGSSGQYDEPALYDEVFLNYSVANPPIDPLDTEQVSGLISDHENIAIFKSALNVSAEDILNLIANGLILESIDIANISALFRVASFCRYNNISIDFFLGVYKLSNSSGVFASINSLNQFITHIDYLKNTPFTTGDLQYLLNDKDDASSILIPSNEEVSTTVDEIRSELIKKRSELIVQQEDKEGIVLEFINPLLVYDPVDSHFNKIKKILDTGTDQDGFLSTHTSYFKNAGLVNKRLIDGADEFLTDADDRKKYFINLHEHLKSEDQIDETLDVLLKRLISENIVTIICGTSDIGETEQNSIIDDQPQLFSNDEFDIQTTKNKLTATVHTDYIAYREDRLDYVIELLSIPANQLKIENLRHILSITIESDVVEKIIDFISNIDVLSGTGKSTPIIPTYEELEFFVEETLSGYLDVDDAKNKLANKSHEDYIANINIRADYLIEKFKFFHLKNLLIDFFSSRLNVTNDLMLDILLSYTHVPDENETHAIEVFLEHAFLDVDVSEKITYDKQINTYLRLYKASVFVNNYSINKEDATILATTSNGHWVDIFNLPVTDDIIGSGSNNYTNWIHLNNAFILQKDIFKGDMSVFKYIDSENGDFETLSKETKWLQSDIEYLYYADNVTNIGNEEWLLKLQQQFNIINRIGAAAKEVIKWNKGPVNTTVEEESAAAIRQSIKAHYDNKQWIEIAEPLRNELRKKQRDALVSYLIGNMDYEDSIDIYDKILMDPEMAPCAMTSRIKQATLSIQLYIQRILLNLEEVGDSKLHLSDTQVEQWQWRKSYRLWEANRKVFLTPENWLEPELRMDKSPMFKKIEEKLTQSEISIENIEALYLEYINDLDEVADLEIAGIYEDMQNRGEDDEYKELHVVGRTRTNPHKYFYRKQIDGGNWTPWQPIDVDIEGDHLVPVFWKGQLFLYWPVFIEKAVTPDNVPFPEDPSPNDPIPLEKPKKYFEIKLAWTRLKDGKWDAKRLSASSFDLNEYSIQYQNIFFNHLHSSGSKKREISLMSLFTLEDRLELTLRFPAQNFSRSDDFSFSLAIINSPNTEPYFKHDMISYYYPITGRGYSELYSNDDLFLDVFRDAEHDTYDQSIISRNNRFNFNIYGFNSFKLPKISTAIADVEYYWEDGGYHIGLHDEFPSLDGKLHQKTFYFDEILECNKGTIIATIPVHNPFYNPVNDPSEINNDWWKLLPWMYLIPQDNDLFKPSQPFFTDMINTGHNFFVSFQPMPPATSAPIGNIIEIGEQVQNAMQPGVIPISGELVSRTSSQQFLPAQFYSNSQASLIIDRSLETNSETLPAIQGGQRDIQTEEEFQYAPLGGKDPLEGNSYGITFQLFQHPYANKFIEKIQYYGLDAFLKIKTEDYTNDIFGSYNPNLQIVNNNYPKKEIDFSESGPYSVYNEELFFHLPMMVANRLSQNQRFKEAMQWYHYIFDPTSANNDESPINFWKYKPFIDAYGDVGNIPENVIDLFLNVDDTDLNAAISKWKNNPFDPHTLAKFRPISYMMNVLMKYIDNLVAWGDMLFKQDSMESLNEATQLYIIAAKLLGRKPEKVDSKQRDAISFNDKKYLWDDFGNSLLELENNVNIAISQQQEPPMMNPLQPNIIKLEMALMMMQTTISRRMVMNPSQQKSTIGQQLYFCIPVNDKLLNYWDTVADRLFKLRNCMNIKGIVRQLPLFQPPIDPGALIKAKAAGVDLTSVLADLNAPLPLYRFKQNLQKAIELTTEVKSLGSALLSALEKRDAEDIAILMATHQEEMQKAMTLIREKSIEEAEVSIESLELSKKITEERKTYYLSRKYIIPQEQMHLDKLDTAMKLQVAAQALGILAGAFSLVPDYDIGVSGFGGTPAVKMQYGGTNFVGVANAAAGVLNILATIEQHQGTKASIKGGYDRRHDDWQHQAKLAEMEIPQIEKQIAGAEIRMEMAEKELENLELQIEQAATELEFMQDKYTNKDLYNWMVTQISTLYFQSYQMAYDMAKRAEKAFRFELGLDDTNFIQFGYWDSLKKGLLSGEKLFKDLQRMDVAFMEENKREYELTNHGSLAMLDPNALIELRNSGKCVFEIPEVMFDLDYPGHYFRRIKSVSISIPAVTGPYTNISCRLTMQNNRYRKTTNDADDYSYKGINDPRFVHNIIGMQSIATSNGQNDSGMFQFNFNDERYLPFEGAGAIGTWSLDMPDKFRQFDYDTIADVIVHINYTAREGGEILKTGAVDNIDEMLAIIGQDGIGLTRLFSMKAEFANELHQFLNPDSGNNATEIVLEKKHFPYFLKEREISINNVGIYIRPFREDWPNFEEISNPALDSPITISTDDQVTEDVDDVWILVEYTIE
jgi:hypothetical protein